MKGHKAQYKAVTYALCRICIAAGGPAELQSGKLLRTQNTSNALRLSNVSTVTCCKGVPPAIAWSGAAGKAVTQVTFIAPTSTVSACITTVSFSTNSGWYVWLMMAISL